MDEGFWARHGKAVGWLGLAEAVSMDEEPREY